MIELEITEENRFSGAYKKAMGTLRDASNKKGETITISLPPPIKRLPQDAITAIQKNIANGKYPIYTVLEIIPKPRGDGKGTYDEVTFTLR